MHWYVQEEETHVAQPAAGGTTSESVFLSRICNKGLKGGRTVGAVLWRKTARATQSSGPQRFRPHLLKSGQNGAANTRHALAACTGVFAEAVWPFHPHTNGFLGHKKKKKPIRKLAHRRFIEHFKKA